MQIAIQTSEETVFYFNNFSILSPPDIGMLCKYKLFMEKMIMRLGEDWRIQSHLLSADIIETRSKQNAEADFGNFNIFNEFLSDFLKGKIGNQQQFTNYSPNAIQEAFYDYLNQRFPQESIQKCLTFKTLTLGFYITGNDVWNKLFREPKRQEKMISSIQAFGKVKKVIKSQSNIKIDSKSQLRSINEFSSIRGKMQRIELISFSEMDNQSERNQAAPQVRSIWKQMAQGDLSEVQLKLIHSTIKKINHNVSKTQILSNFACFVDQLRFNSGIKVRVFSLSNQFYLFAFIVWLIFSIKTFFELPADDYVRYSKQLMLDQWKEEYERPLQKFQVTIEKERYKLLNDYAVNLHDDEAVLIKLAERLQAEIKREWDQKISNMKECFQKEI